jgi:integrase
MGNRARENLEEDQKTTRRTTRRKLVQIPSKIKEHNPLSVSFNTSQQQSPVSPIKHTSEFRTRGGRSVTSMGKSDKHGESEKGEAPNAVLYEFMGSYLAELEDLGRSPTTINNYERHFIRLFECWPTLQIKDFDSTGFLALLEARTPTGWQKTTRGVFLVAIGTFGNWLARRKLTNTRHRATSPSRRPKWRQLPTDDEVLRLIASLSEMAKLAPEGRRRTRENNWLIVRILEETGMRVGEVLGLTVDDVFYDEHGGRIMISENDHRGLKSFAAERAVEISGQLALDLRSFRARWHIARGLIFKSKTRRPLAPNEFTKWLNKYCRDFGIKCVVTPHVFRHRFILKVIERGDSALSVMSRIGHEDVEMTVYYFNQVRRLMPWVELNGDVALLERTRRFWKEKGSSQR